MNYITAHGVEDQDKVETLAASMAKDGWIGAPVITCDDMQVTGVHRAAAAQLAEIEMETLTLEDVFAEDGADWSEVSEIFNNFEGYNAFIPLTEAVALLSPGTRDKYGIDLE